MDIVIIGKRGFGRSERPHVVYCGQSRAEADQAVQAAVNAQAGFVRFYSVNAEPFLTLRVPSFGVPPSGGPTQTSTKVEQEQTEGTEEQKPSSPLSPLPPVNIPVSVEPEADEIPVEIGFAIDPATAPEIEPKPRRSRAPKS
jgi:hypothetical protein